MEIGLLRIGGLALVDDGDLIGIVSDGMIGGGKEGINLLSVLAAGVMEGGTIFS